MEFLRNATPAAIQERVRNLLEKVMPRGNWVLCTSDFPFDGLPYENMQAFADAGTNMGATTKRHLAAEAGDAE